MRERRRARRRRKGKMPPVHGCIVFGCPICTSAAGATDQAGGQRVKKQSIPPMCVYGHEKCTTHKPWHCRYGHLQCLVHGGVTWGRAPDQAGGGR